MKKRLFHVLLALIGLVFASCTNDDNSENTSLLLPKTVTFKDRNNKIYQTATFTYDGYKIINISSENSDIDFTYKGNQIVKEVQYRNYGESYSEKLFGYSNDSLKAVTKLLNGREIRYLYFDNHDGTIKKEINKIDIETVKPSENCSIDILTFEKGNLIKSVSNWESGSYLTTCRYDYDANNNAFRNILGLNLLLDQADFISEEGLSSTNNIKKYSSSTSHNSDIVSDSSERIVFEPYFGTINYEYNSKGYPTKKTTYDYRGEITEIIEFTY